MAVRTGHAGGWTRYCTLAEREKVALEAAQNCIWPASDECFRNLHVHRRKPKQNAEKCGAPHRGYAVFIRNNLPELGANLVAALATLNVNNFSHFRARKK